MGLKLSVLSLNSPKIKEKNIAGKQKFAGKEQLLRMAPCHTPLRIGP